MQRQKLRRIVLFALTLLPLTAFALTLDEARAQGLVGEDWTGFIAAVAPNPSKEVQALVSEVNAKRRTVYEKIAKETATPQDPVTADDVGQLGAGKVFDKAAPGTYIRLQGQSWTKKP
jgi:uncharacterized protein YdbL (DUF1318 family)